jgi:enoyl-CoA hydratase/carnithine racemase
MSEAVLYETRGPAAWITLNRPEKLNAINKAVLAGLHDAIDRATADDEVKVVVVAGAGRAFSAGYDLADEAAGEYGAAHDWHHALGVDRSRRSPPCRATAWPAGARSRWPATSSWRVPARASGSRRSGTVPAL